LVQLLSRQKMSANFCDIYCTETKKKYYTQKQASGLFLER
jgi:hypothetical protein